MTPEIASAFRAHARQMGTSVSVIMAFILFAMSPSAHAQPLFQPEIQIDAGLRPKAVAIGDLNGDGKPDLVIGNAGALKYVDPGFFFDSSYVSVRLGNADGTFGPRVGYRLGNSQVPSQVVIADLNGDDHPDLLLPTRDPVQGIQLVWRLLGNGDGTFQPQKAVSAGGPSIAVGDLNGDDRPDLVIAGESASNTVSVHLGIGDGTFGTATPFTTGASTKAVGIADLDHDGVPDLVTANAPAVVSILRGNGNGTFAPRTDYPTSTAPTALAVEDLNRDGLPDLAVLFGTYVCVHYNLGDGVLGPLYAYAVGASATGLAIANFDFDRWPDLAVATSGGSTAIMLANGDGTFGPQEDFAPGGVSIAVGDLNGDFEPDVATALESENAVSILFNVPDQPLAASAPQAGDGGFDLVAPNPSRDVSQIEYTVARAGAVRLEVVDVTGRVVATLFEGIQPVGRHHASWNGSAGNERLPAGLYFIRLTTPDRAITGKLIRIR